MLIRLLALCLAVSWALPATARGAPWQAPVDGEVAARFAYSPARPFEAGARRGADLVAVPGASVRAACSGRVSFAGRLPSGGRGVSVRCGALTATHLGLGAVAVHRGARVHAGAALGVAGPGGVVRLGARVTARRFGYVDPLALIGGRRDAPPLAPLGRAPRPAAPHVVRSPRPPLVHRTPRPAANAAPAMAVPPAAWAGLALLAAGVPLGGLVRRRRRQRPVVAYSRTGPLVSGRWLASSRSSWR